MTQAIHVDTPCVPGKRLDGAEEVPRGSTARTHRLAMDAVTRIYNPYVEERELAAAVTPPSDVGPFMREVQVFGQIHPRLTPVVRDGELIVGARVRGEGEEPHHWLPDGYDRYIAGFARNAPPHDAEVVAMAERGLISPQGSLNHKSVDYPGIIRTGCAEMARRARAVAETREGEEREFALAFAQGHEIMIAHARTYARACVEAAEVAPPERAAELRELARICERVPELPAETLHEALQSLWFLYMVGVDAPGRVDVYLNQFYQADRASGRITPERALELIECFMIKLHGDVSEGSCNVSSIQTMTLGGVLADGSDACNDLTRLFLTAVRNVRLLRPTVYVRCCETTPDDVLELAVTMLGEGVAEPNFYGDRPIIEGLRRLGLPVAVARDYALSGCTEIISPGRGNWGAPNGWINLALIADEALREYAGSGGTSSEGLWETIEAHVEAAADACRRSNIWVDEQVGGARYGSTLLMPVTLDRCRDILHGGAETYLAHWEAIGLPNAADMVYAAEQVALAENGPLAPLLSRLDSGDTFLYGRLKTLPKFGNDHADVDAVAARLVQLMADALEKRKTPLRQALVLGHLAGGENMHMAYGHAMGATLDGRAAGQPLADSLAGSQGQTTSGPTAVVRSLCRLDHSRLIAGNVSTLRLSRSDFATESERAKVVALIRTFVELGGSQLQFNVVDADTLRAAQAHPEEHEGLMVRVAGYSAEFTHVGKRLQDEIIARLEGLQ